MPCANGVRTPSADNTYDRNEQPGLALRVPGRCSLCHAEEVRCFAMFQLGPIAAARSAPDATGPGRGYVRPADLSLLLWSRRPTIAARPYRLGRER
jgi:hypothetical protein